jgi:hypothetical protein
MNTFIMVIAAVLFSYFCFGGLVKTVGALASAQIKIGKFEIPALMAVFTASFLSIIVWILYDAFGIKAAAVVVLVAIEAIAFYSIDQGDASDDSALLWLVKAFGLGGLFILCIAMLA